MQNLFLDEDGCLDESPLSPEARFESKWLRREIFFATRDKSNYFVAEHHGGKIARFALAKKTRLNRRCFHFFLQIPRVTRVAMSKKGRWEDVHKAVIYAELNSDKHKKANGTENLSAAAAAAASALETLRPGTTADQIIQLVRKERARAQVGMHARSAVRNWHKASSRRLAEPIASRSADPSEGGLLSNNSMTTSSVRMS